MTTIVSYILIKKKMTLVTWSFFKFFFSPETNNYFFLKPNKTYFYFQYLISDQAVGFIGGHG